MRLGKDLGVVRDLIRIERLNDVGNHIIGDVFVRLGKAQIELALNLICQ